MIDCENMENEKLEWHQVKGQLLAMKGDQIIAIVEKLDGMPCESFGVNMLNGVFTNTDAAKAEVERAWQEHLSHSANRLPELPNYGKVARAIADLFDPPVPAKQSAQSQIASPEATAK